MWTIWCLLFILSSKSLFSLVFQAKNRPFCCTFHLNQNQRENSIFLSEVHLFSIRCEGTKISGIFTNRCQLKARCTHEDFAAKRKTGCIIGRLRQIGWSVWRSHFFSSLSSDVTLIGVYMSTGIK